MGIGVKDARSSIIIGRMFMCKIQNFSLRGKKTLEATGIYMRTGPVRKTLKGDKRKENILQFHW